MFAHDYKRWDALDDLEVIGRKVSTACYVEHAVPAVIHLARRYGDDPEAGLIANTMAGGDNCYRGVVLGALLGAANGRDAWPGALSRGTHCCARARPLPHRAASRPTRPSASPGPRPALPSPGRPAARL